MVDTASVVGSVKVDNISSEVTEAKIQSHNTTPKKLARSFR